MPTIPLGLALILWISIRQKKYKQLLNEGKITREGYDRIMKCHTSSVSNNEEMRINPATGLPMTGIGISDVSGNIRGSPSSRDSMRNVSQEYRDRHRWD
ncbi:MAG: hypothetical protein ACD_69C00362G0005 [uncultured bacterium]|nr:MAG: hypothetical protein ACD_69C00362G0005 [uncultured bacterium]